MRLLTSVLVFTGPVLLQAQATAVPASDRISTALYLEWEDVQDPQLSPDRNQIAFTRRWVDKLNDRWESAATAAAMED